MRQRSRKGGPSRSERVADSALIGIFQSAEHVQIRPRPGGRAWSGSWPTMIALIPPSIPASVPVIAEGELSTPSRIAQHGAGQRQAGRRRSVRNASAARAAAGPPAGSWSVAEEVQRHLVRAEAGELRGELRALADALAHADDAAQPMLYRLDQCAGSGPHLPGVRGHHLAEEGTARLPGCGCNGATPHARPVRLPGRGEECRGSRCVRMPTPRRGPVSRRTCDIGGGGRSGGPGAAVVSGRVGWRHDEGGEWEGEGAGTGGRQIPDLLGRQDRLGEEVVSVVEGRREDWSGQAHA